MKAKIMRAVVAGLLLSPCILIAQIPAGAPSGTTGKCKDGTYTSTPTKQGACRGHKGIDTWYAAAAPALKSATGSSSAAPASAPRAASEPASAVAPTGATGKCKDGTFTTAPKKQGACRGHKGVDSWYADAAAPPAAAAKTPAPAPSPASAPAPVSTPTQSAPRTSTRTSVSSKTPAPGGGPGLVWVNSSTNVYHCYGAQFYGTTKAGKYMTEADARAAGARPDRNKPCSAK